MKWPCSYKAHRRLLRRGCAVTTFLVLNAVPLAQAFAQTVTVTQDLEFGFVRILDNNGQHQIQFTGANSFSADPEYTFYDEPVIARVEVTGFTPDTNLNITFAPPSPGLMPANGTGPAFEVSDFFTIPANVKTNGVGNADFRVGATLKTSGTTNHYRDTDFTAQVMVQVEEDP